MKSPQTIALGAGVGLVLCVVFLASNPSIPTKIIEVAPVGTISNLTEQQARSIAESSCVKGGTALGAGLYNKNTKIWIFDANLNARQEGCDSLCVVDDSTRIATMNRQCKEPIDTTQDNKVASGYITGHVTIGPFCPVEREGQPCQIPIEAYTSRSAVIYESDTITVKEKVKLDNQGNFKITIAPGTYYLQIEPAGIGPGEKKKVIVTSLKTTVSDFNIDTGIR